MAVCEIVNWPRLALPYVNEILIGAADNVVVGDRNGVDAPARGLQNVHALQIPDVPDLGSKAGGGEMRGQFKQRALLSPPFRGMGNQDHTCLDCLVGPAVQVIL